MSIATARIDWPRAVPLAVLAVSVGAIAFAYAAEFGWDLEPCILCLYQRMPYAAAGILGMLALMAPRGRVGVWAVAAAGAVFLIGAGIAFYHVGVEQRWWLSAAACGAAADQAAPATVGELQALLAKGPDKACDAIDWTLFGVSMATYNVAASLVFAAGSFCGAGRMRRVLGSS